MTYHGQQLTNEMNDCKGVLEVLRQDLAGTSIQQPGSYRLLKAKMSYLIKNLETPAAIKPLAIFHLGWETQLSDLAIVFSYLIVLVNFKLLASNVT